MQKESLLDEIRTYLEDVENYWLALSIVIALFIVVSVVTLFGVFLYTRH
jgi:hypothetical protein